MRILAFDVAIKGIAVGCFDFTAGIAVRDFYETERGQAEFLIPMIDTLVARAKWGRHDIDRIAVTTGPGSFTGVRIGLATARHLGLVLDRPVVGVSTFDVVRAGIEFSDALIIFDTQRGDYYGQAGTSGDMRIWSVDEVGAYTGHVIRDSMPDVEKLAYLAQHVQCGHVYDPHHAPDPLYLRGAEVSSPKKNPRVFSKTS